MESTKTKKGGKTKALPDFRKAYIEYYLEQGKAPASVFAFTKALGIEENLFYDSYSSFEALEAEIWKGLMEETQKRLVNDPSYGPYSAREKMLALYFTMAEVLKANRSYLLLKWPSDYKPEINPAWIKGFKEVFKNLANDILNEGKESGEVLVRPYISERYDEALWLQCLFIIRFWIKDNSKSFENTDAAIEKSVNLAFDLFGQSPLDSIIDFGKFLFQHR